MAESMVYYIIGDDPNSRSNDMSSTIDKLVGNQDKSLCVESFDLADADSEELRIQVIENAVNSLLSPPFLTPMRIVVIRDIGAASTEEVSSLIEYLKDPTPSLFLVVVQGGGQYLRHSRKALGNLLLLKLEQLENQLATFLKG